jgi:hypothetical protein
MKIQKEAENLFAKFKANGLGDKDAIDATAFCLSSGSHYVGSLLGYNYVELSKTPNSPRFADLYGYQILLEVQ